MKVKLEEKIIKPLTTVSFVWIPKAVFRLEDCRLVLHHNKLGNTQLYVDIECVMVGHIVLARFSKNTPLCRPNTQIIANVRNDDGIHQYKVGVELEGTSL